MAIEFSSYLKQAEGVNATGIPIPLDVIERVGAKKNGKLLVNVRKAGSSDDWFGFQIAIGSRGGEYLLSFSGALRKESGLAAGDRLDVSVELA